MNTSIHNTQISSPLTRSNNVTLVSNIKVKDIVKTYDKRFNIDVTNFFYGIKKISVFRCNDTGYLFYHPLNLMGDSDFYEHFQTYDWYYSQWKWEHEVTLQYLHTGMKILEVGCAHGTFLEKINNLFDLDYSVGLELNESTKKENDKWVIKNQSIQEYAKLSEGLFDLVCSYQVLEHISDVHSFLNAKIECLKNEGTLIISVPNNNSFIKNNRVGLNSPPHHMGLWTEKSLKALEKIFPISLQKFHFEELQEYHVGDYVYSEFYSKYPKMLVKFIQKLNQAIGVYKKQTQNILAKKNNLPGHTILAVYKKV